MKKIIFIIISLVSYQAYSQPSCTGINVHGATKMDTAKCCYLSIGGTLISTPPGGTTQFLRADGNFAVPPGTGPSGTVTAVSVVTANGVSGSVANPTTTPAITLTLGAITPSAVNGVTLSGSSTPTLAVTGTATVSGANTGDQTSVSGSAGSAPAVTLTGTTINSSVTASSLVSFGTSPSLVAPLLGTPTSGVLTNCTGVASGLTAGNVTTNANLTGPITSVGNATSITAQTGTTSVFAMQNRPVFTSDITSPDYKVLSTGTGYDLYNTSDTTTNFERLRIYKPSNVYTLEDQVGGSGTHRTIRMKSNIVQLDVAQGGAILGASASTGSLATGFRTNYTASSSGTVQNFIGIVNTVNQTSTAGYRCLWISPFEQATGSGSKLLIDAGTNSSADGGGAHTSLFSIDNIGSAVATSLVLNKNISAASWTINGIKIMIPAKRLTNTSSSGTVAIQYNNIIAGDTIGCTSPTTFTNMANVFIGANKASTNTTFSNSGYSLALEGGIIFNTANDIVIRHLGSRNIFFGSNGATAFNINSSNKVFIGGGGTTSGTAYLHLAAGTATASTAPLKLTSGTNLTTTEAGAVEYDGTHLYYSAVNSGPRYTLDRQAIGGSVSATGTATTTFTVTIGATQANSTYKVTATPSNVLSAAVFYINNKTTTTFDVVYLAGLTGAVAFDWILTP